MILINLANPHAIKAYTIIAIIVLGSRTACVSIPFVLALLNIAVNGVKNKLVIE
jgi:hypothetical protein